MIRVLLVDDQAIVRAGLRTMLGVEPDLVVVGEAEDGRQAVIAAVDLDPDVVLMDIRMPVLDGITATAQIVKSATSARVCVLTTHGLDEYVFDAMAAGASGFLVKTDTPQQIAATVRAVAAGDFALGTETTERLVSGFLRRTRPTPSGSDPLAALTTREREVFALVADGMSNTEIADLLVVGQGTVKTHVARILMKLVLRDRIQVVVFAHRNGLVR